MKITIIGSGDSIASCVAFNIATHKIADELVMIDTSFSDELENCVSDLTSAVAGLNTLVRSGNFEDMLNSDIVLITAGSDNAVTSMKDVLPQNLPLIQEYAQKIKQFCPQAIVITLTCPVDPLNYAMYRFSGLNRKRLIGYSANDSIFFRKFLSQALGIKSSQLEATVIGGCGSNQVLLFSSVKINGKPSLVSMDIQKQVRQEISHLPAVLEFQRMQAGRMADWTTSMGLTSICKAISHNTGEFMPCSVVLDGEYGYHNMAMSLPVKLGKDGILEIQDLKLFSDEQINLKQAVKTLQQSMQYIDTFIV